MTYSHEATLNLFTSNADIKYSIPNTGNPESKTCDIIYDSTLEKIRTIKITQIVNNS